MRLPALTKPQRDREDARAFHEGLWTAYGSQDAVVVAIGEEKAGAVEQRISSNCKNFWSRRGYRLRFARTVDGSGVRVWLEAFI